MSWKFRIHRCHARRRRLGHVMMICHHRINPQASGIRNLYMAQTAGIHCHDQICAHIAHLVHGTHGHTIALNKPIRDESIDALKAKLTKRIQQQCRGAQPINIIITINDDFFAPLPRLFQPRHCLLHVRQQKRIMFHRHIIWLQKSLARCPRHQTARRQTLLE